MHTRRPFIKTVVMGATAATSTPGCGSGPKPHAETTPGLRGLSAARGTGEAALTQLRA